MHIIKHTSSPPSLSPAHQGLANGLAAIHGDLSAAQERSGLHFYIACPDCLAENGEAELSSRHLAVCMGG